MTTTESAPQTEPQTINLAVGGMTCAGCASTIQRGLAMLPGVDGADVNIATRRATVNVDGTMDPAELEDMMRAAITGLGYQVLTPAKGETPAEGDAMSLADEHAAHIQRRCRAHRRLPSPVHRGRGAGAVPRC